MSGNNEHAIWENLRGTECVCGDEKLPGKSFCKRHYRRLPGELRDGLYRPRINNYVASYRAALAFLKLREPGASAEVQR